MLLLLLLLLLLIIILLLLLFEIRSAAREEIKRFSNVMPNIFHNMVATPDRFSMCRDWSSLKYESVLGFVIIYRHLVLRLHLTCDINCYKT